MYHKGQNYGPILTNVVYTSCQTLNKVLTYYFSSNEPGMSVIM